MARKAVKKLRPRMVPRRVSIDFRWALSGEPVAHAAIMRPGGKVGAVLTGLCEALGRPCEETGLVFEGKRLRSRDTLARSGLRGAVELGRV